MSSWSSCHTGSLEECSIAREEQLSFLWPSSRGEEPAEPRSGQCILGLQTVPRSSWERVGSLWYSQRRQARQVHQECLEILEGPRRESNDTVLTP